MQSRVPRVILTVFFVMLFAIPVLLRKQAERKEHADKLASSHPDISLSRYGFHLEEAAHESGIDFIHQAPVLDSKLDQIMPEIASMGAAVSIVDYDRDGLPDIYVTNSAAGSKNCLYHNLGNGKFKDVASELGIADLNLPGDGVSMGAVWGDYDNDGYEDLLLYRWGKQELFHNEAGKGFTRVTDTAGLPKWVNANSAIWLDYDNDGKLDLLICGYYPENIDLWHLKDTRMMPTSFEFAANGGRKYLMHNLGNGRFEDVTVKMGLNSTRWTLAAVAADLRGTGYPDIFLSNDYGVSEVYLNDKGKGFHESGKNVLYWGIGTGPKSGMSASVGDIFNTGKYSIYVSNITEEGVLIQGNNLWVPKERKPGEEIQYDNQAGNLGVERGGWSFGAQFGDLNNDGSLDIFLTNGFVSGDKSQNYWYDFAKVAVGNSAIIGDAKNWPAIGNRSHAGYQQKRLWLNDGAGKFTEVAQMSGVTDTHDGRSVALADLFNTGSMDVLVANQKGPLLLYKNSVDPHNQWVEFDLEGTRSNRSGIGAQVTLRWNGQEQLQEVSGGSGFCAQNDRRLHFGLGKNPQIKEAVVRWPSGKIQTITAITPHQVMKIKEPV